MDTLTSDEVWNQRKPTKITYIDPSSPEGFEAVNAVVESQGLLSNLGEVKVSRQMTRHAVRAQLYAASSSLPGNRKQRREFSRQLAKTAYQMYNLEQKRGE